MKPTPQYILSSEDINFLSRYTGKSLEELKEIAVNLKTKFPKATDYDYIDLISNRKGTETYHALSNYRIQSREYMNTFKYLGNMKSFDLNTPDGMKQHVYRNKNQFGKAPQDMYSMAEFIKAGYFIAEGFSPCHNINPKINTYDSRYATLSQMVYCFKHDLLTKPNKFAPFQNMSFRGVSGTSFEGCQFIYCFKTGKLVVDSTNRGTWDFSKYATPSHYLMDILPWLSVGNGDNIETPQMFLMTKDKEDAYLKFANKNITKIEINDSEKDKTPNFLTTVISLAKTYFNKNKAFESLSVPGEVYAKEHAKEMIKAKEDLVSNYIENRIGYQKLASCYQKDLENFTKLTTLLSGYDILSGIDNYVKYCTTDPQISVAIAEKSKNKFLYSIMKSTICLTTKLARGTVYEMKMPFVLNLYYSDNLMAKFTDIQSKLGDNILAQQTKFYVENYILCHIKDKLKECDARFVVKEYSNDCVSGDIYLNHTVTDFEVVYANKDNIQAFADKNNITVPIESKEELTPLIYPEYSFEALGTFGTLSIVVAAVCIVAGVSYGLYQNCKDEVLLSKIKEHSELIDKELSNEYHRCFKIIQNIKKSSFLKDLQKWDITGKYHYITKSDDNYKSSMDYESEESFVENVLLKMAHEVNKSVGTGKMDRLAIDNMTYTYPLLSGSPMHDLLMKSNGSNTELASKKIILNNIDRCCTEASDPKERYRVIYNLDTLGDLIDLKVSVVISNNIDSKRLSEFIELIKKLK